MKMRVCKYSPDCFTCPERDCRVKKPANVNEILSKSVYNAFLNDPDIRKERKAARERKSAQECEVKKEPGGPAERGGWAQTYTYNGESKTLGEWAEVCGISANTIYRRINYSGWSLEKALFTPSQRQRKVAR